MAKGTEISLETRKFIIKLYLGNKSYREIGSIIGRSFSSVRNIVIKFGKTATLNTEPRSGRPKIFSPKEQRIIVNTIKKDSKFSAPKICQEMLKSTGKKSDPQTVRNVLYKAGYHGRSARKKPLISKVNCLKRRKFADSHKNKTDEFWKNVVFSDESKFNIFGSDGHAKVWRKKKIQHLIRKILFQPSNMVEVT